MCFPSELASKDLNDYENSKAYSCHKSGWLRPLFFNNLAGSNFCILKGECSKSQSVSDNLNNFRNVSQDLVAPSHLYGGHG